MKRAIIFAHYDKDDIVEDYVLYYLRSLTEECDRLVFVSTANLPESEISKVESICDKVVVRENIGYDFISYKTGLGQLDSADYDEVVLCNDSVYGPIFPISEMFRKMERVKCGFWSVTDSCERAYHLQSYFLAFRKEVLKAVFFREFWDNLSIKEVKQEIVDEYEVGLSKMLFTNGVTGKAYCEYRPTLAETLQMQLRKMVIFISTPSRYRNLTRIGTKIKNIFTGLLRSNNGCSPKLNPTHFFWRQLIELKRMPFIKVELLRDNPMGVKIKGWEEFISSLSAYNTDYIKKHLQRVKPGRT